MGGFQWVRERGGAHGLYIDHKGNVWTGTHTPGARYTNAFANLAKFTREGKFLMQKGAFGQSKGNADTENFGQPTGIVVDPETNEAFVSDGYDNRRIIVVDGDTMAFKRMWGAYGNKPIDDPLPPRTSGDKPAQQFRGVHCIKMSRDGLLYVCDRPSDRVQVFRKDGSFVKEGYVTANMKGTGTVADVAFSADPEQRFLYVADGLNRKVWILLRDTLEVVGSFGNRGYYGGEFAGYLHALATDSKGNVYVGEHEGGYRVQRFRMAVH
jgi:DNA-binding beta-propeller fold protein YncE